MPEHTGQLSGSERISIHPDARMFVTREDWQRMTLLRAFSLQVGAAVARGTPLLHAVNDALASQPLAEEMVQRPTSSDDPAFGLRPEVMFPPAPVPLRSLSFAAPGAGPVRAVDLDGGPPLSETGRLLWLCSSGLLPDELQAALPASHRPLAETLLADGFLVRRPRPEPSRLATPGVHRLQHACLLFRSETHGLLVDPVLHSPYQPAAAPALLSRTELTGLVDAILLSHSHGDHYDLSSLLTFSPHTTIVVPRVPRGSVICEDMAGRLRALGFTNVLTPEWYAPPVRIGDFEIHALPFYGEQPLRFEHPRHPDLRNWGNTYLVASPGVTAWVLIDSGADARGEMTEVAKVVRDRATRVDAVLSNLREFALFTPTYITGNGSYWACLTPEQMSRFPGMRRHVITLGPDGVAELCRMVGARSFLPYAHWWAGLGEEGQRESALLGRLAGALRARLAATEIVEWKIGDHWLPAPGAAGRGAR